MILLSKISIEVVQSQAVNPIIRLSKTSIEVVQTQSVSPVARLSKTSIEVVISPLASTTTGGESVQVIWQ